MNTTCPFCNAVVTIPDRAPARIPCSRCGETFPTPTSTNGPPASDGSSLPVALAPAPPATNRSNRAIALLVIAFMALLAGAAVVFMIQTRGKRGLVPLAELDVLGYLPADTNVVAAVNVPVAEESKPGRELLDRIGFKDGGPLAPERFIGLPRDQIEDAVVGLNAGKLIPDIRLVVRTRGSYDAAKLREKLGATRSRTEGNKTVDLVRFPGLPFEAALWCATPRTFVVIYPERDMAKVPDEPVANAEQLSAPLVELLTYRSNKGTFFWLVGHVPDWEKTPLALLALPAETRNNVVKVRSIGLGLRMDTGAVTSRRRPARVTEEAHPEQAGVAVDLVLKTAGGGDAVDVKTAFENWLDRMKLELKDANLSDNHYSATVTGSAGEWERALNSVRDLSAKKK